MDHEDYGTNLGGPDRVQGARIEAEASPADERGLRPHAQEPGQAVEDPRASPLQGGQGERALMHPEADDPEWRYYFGAWHS